MTGVGDDRTRDPLKGTKSPSKGDDYYDPHVETVLEAR